MKKNNFLVGLGIAALVVLSSSAAFATTIEVITTNNVTGVEDIQTATAGIIQSTTTDTNGDSTSSFSGGFFTPATATAYATESGLTGASVDGIFACGSCNFDLSAEAYYQTIFTNDTATSVDFTYNFLIYGPSVELFDYANVDQSAGLGAEARASVFMTTDSGATDELILYLGLVGGDAGSTVTAIGGTATAFNTGGSFGYTMDNVSGSFSGTLAAGETATIDSIMFAAIFGPGWELGARASIGDPNDFSTTPGFSGQFEISAVSTVPLPASAWFFATGLLGLFGASKRKKV